MADLLPETSAGGTCPCGRSPDPGILPAGGCACTLEDFVGGLTTEAGMVLHALRDETVQRVIGVVMGLPLADVKSAADELNEDRKAA